MKKIIYSVFMMVMVTMAFTSCADVPMPYDDPNQAAIDDAGTVVEPAGLGTADDPYNVAAANALIESGEAPSTNVYVKGIIVSIKEIDTGSYGNATYYISDDGTSVNQLTVYRGLSLGNKKFTSEEEIKDGDEVVVCGVIVNYNGTYEFTQGNYIYSLNGETTGGGSSSGKTIGSADSPLSITDVLQLINALGNNESSNDLVYVTGTVKEIQTSAASIAQYKNCDFVITDGSNNTVKVFRGRNLNNTDFTSADQITAGDEVVVVGNYMKYEKDGTVTPEITNGYLVKRTASSGGGSSTGTVVGSLENPLSTYDVLQLINALSNNESGKDQVYVKGKIKEIITSASDIVKYKNCDFVITDGNNDVKVFRGKYLNNADFTTGNEIKVDDEVVVFGNYMKYEKDGTVTPEITNGYIAQLNGQGSSSGGDTPSSGGTTDGNTLTVQASDLGLGNGEAAGTKTLADGTTLTFDGGGNTNAPKYYQSGTNIRMYPKNSLTISATKNISSVTLSCDEVSGVICNASKDVSASPGSISFSEKDIIVTQINSNKVVITNNSTTTGTASQIRFIKLVITYAQ